VPDVIPLVQAAAEFGVDRATLYRYLKAGRLKRYKRGMDRRTYVDRGELKKIVRPRVIK
jgi:predicted site-specific integrase-resolvase